MLLFTKRMKLGIAFSEYAQKYKVIKDPLNTITWLHGYGMLNEEKCKEFIEEFAMKTSDSMDEVETSEQNQ